MEIEEVLSLKNYVLIESNFINACTVEAFIPVNDKAYYAYGREYRFSLKIKDLIRKEKNTKLDYFLLKRAVKGCLNRISKQVYEEHEFDLVVKICQNSRISYYVGLIDDYEIWEFEDFISCYVKNMMCFRALKDPEKYWRL